MAGGGTGTCSCKMHTGSQISLPPSASCDVEGTRHSFIDPDRVAFLGRFRYRERTHLPSFQSLGAVEVAFVSQEDACWFAGMQHGIQAEAPFA